MKDINESKAMISIMILLLIAAGFAIYGYRLSSKGKIWGAVVAFFMFGLPAGFLVAGMSAGAPLAWALGLALLVICICITKQEKDRTKNRDEFGV